MFRIKKLDIFIVKQCFLLFIATFFVCQFILMMQFLFQYVDTLIGKGLSMKILAEFFWYMGLYLVPQALPLAVLLSSLMTMGNLGERSELTAIKASGISLIQAMRPLIVLSVLVCLLSFFLQNVVTPKANMKVSQMFISMRQKSPELEIPEGIFYDGIPNSNLYVQKKDMKTGKLYGIMIYRMTGSYEDQAIILADSGMIQSTAEKKHLLISLWNGVWYENMTSQDFGNAAMIPYRRENFVTKKILLDYNTDFNLTDASLLSNNAKSKSLSRLSRDIDSLNVLYDSLGRVFYHEAKRMYYPSPSLSKNDSLKAIRLVKSGEVNFDTLYNKLPPEDKARVLGNASSNIQSALAELNFQSMLSRDGDQLIREHKIESINKFTLALSVLIFFFIGAPLGAIIRKGGIGVPIIVSILVFIVYYILDNTGYRMAKGGMWTIAFGKGLAPVILIPLSAFVTYKASNDSVVFNIEAWIGFLKKLLGLRRKRHIFTKEVIIDNPDYAGNAIKLEAVSEKTGRYMRDHKLNRLPDFFKVFFEYEEDDEIQLISDELEAVIEDLSNTRDRVVLTEINKYPFVLTHSHKRPFKRIWLNILFIVILPVGLFFYFRMWRYRRRLYKDLKLIQLINKRVIRRSRAISK